MSKNIKRTKRLVSLAKPLKNRKKHILQLPNEILHRILDAVPVCNFHRVRATCRLLKQISDNHLIHNFYMAVSQNGASESKPENAVLQVIQQATRAFVAGGNNQSMFSACLLLLSNRSFQSIVYVTNAAKLNIFLERFFDEIYSKPVVAQSHLLFLNTLLGFLNRSDLATRTCTILHGKQNGIELTYTMIDSWFGILWASKRRELQYPDDSKAVILLLSHILLCVLEDTCYRNVIEYGSKVFLYGREKADPERRQKNKMIWSIRVVADQHVIDVLQSSSDTMDWQSLSANSNLEVAIDLKCSKSYPWGCCWYHHFEI